MWPDFRTVKPFILIGTALLLSACGADAVSEPDDIRPNISTSENVPQDQTQTLGTGGGTQLASRSGQLSLAHPPAFAELQGRVAAQLFSGLAPDAFTGVGDPDTMIMRVTGGGKANWHMDGDRRKLYLVSRNLERASPIDAGFCDDGEIYTGFAAARPFISEEFRSTALRITYALPYGLLVCERGQSVALKLVPASEIEGAPNLPINKEN